jgi:hypothetical protein
MKINDVINEAGPYKPPGSYTNVPAQPADTAAAVRAGKGGQSNYQVGKDGPANIGNQSFAPPGNQSAQIIQWPTTPDEVKAFQTSQNIKPVDGKIGKNTMAALNKAGAKAPPGFIPVADKAKPATPKAGADAQGNVPIPSGGVGASTQAQVDAANAQQAPQGSDTTTAGNAPDELAAVKKNAGIEPPATNPFGVQPQANVPGMQTGAEPATNPFGVQPQANVPGMQTGTAPDTQAAQAAAAPSALPNPWDGKDPAKAAAWSALSPEDQKWLGNADPTDKFILARSPSKGGFVGSITPNFMKKKQPAAAPAAPVPGQSGQAAPQNTFSEESSDLTAMLRIAGLR